MLKPSSIFSLLWAGAVKECSDRACRAVRCLGPRCGPAAFPTFPFALSVQMSTHWERRILSQRDCEYHFDLADGPQSRFWGPREATTSLGQPLRYPALIRAPKVVPGTSYMFNQLQLRPCFCHLSKHHFSLLKNKVNSTHLLGWLWRIPAAKSVRRLALCLARNKCVINMKCYYDDWLFI